MRNVWIEAMGQVQIKYRYNQIFLTNILNLLTN